MFHMFILIAIYGKKMPTKKYMYFLFPLPMIHVSSKQHNLYTVNCALLELKRSLFIFIFFFSGDSLQISDYSGDFQESRLSEAKEIILIAGGTGLLSCQSNNLTFINPLNQSISRQTTIRPVSQSVSQSVSQPFCPSVSH